MAVKQLIGKIAKADRDYHLIQDGDRIAIGISGGKDSMMLLYCLHLYQKVAERYDHKHFDVVGIHLEMGFPNMDFEPVRAFCRKHEIEYYDIPTRMYDILKLNANDDGSLKCSLCSTLKKGAVVKEAKNLNCNKTAFAHHADDAIETLFLNAIYGGRLATFATSMHLDNSDMDFIRPFVYCFENEIKSSALSLNLPIITSTCPMDGYTQRQDIKELLHSIYHKYPQSKQNFLTMLSNTEKTELWIKAND